MTPAVKLRDLTDTLLLPNDWSAWLDCQTGHVIALDPETRDAAGEYEEDDSPLLPITLIDDESKAARAIAAGDPRYLALPDSFEFHEYRHMERFVASQADPLIADQLWRAIKGKGAFRHFKDTAHRLGLIDDWYRYRDEAAARFMLDWAEANGVTVDRSPPLPGN
jgi:hypothetical protein